MTKWEKSQAISMLNALTSPNRDHSLTRHTGELIKWKNPCLMNQNYNIIVSNQGYKTSLPKQCTNFTWQTGIYPLLNNVSAWSQD